jgi:PIN domain nuclease of toxin-antitoxin system
VARFLLDTQAFLVLDTEGLDAFTRNVRGLLVDTDNEFLLSAVSVSEVAIKTSIGKLKSTPKDVSRATVDLRLTLIPYTPAHATRLFRLPLHHRDPFDRMLIATAMAEGVPIIAADRAFKQYRGLKVIW